MKSELFQSPNPNPRPVEISVLERQRAHARWQPEPIATYFNDDELMDGGFLFGNGDHVGLGELLAVTQEMKPDPGLENGWNDGFFGGLPSFGNGSEFEISSHPLPRTISCPPAVVEVAAGKESPLSSATGNKENPRKRKADKSPNLKVVAEEKCAEKKMKGSYGEENSKKETENSNGKSSITTVANEKKKGSSTDNSKGSDIPKPDYIHVRARRGQATDSHSLAERVRREKISERMKYLQDLVPGCNKITGKAGMLDEIINYVQSLQKQVEFLSMKLATINPTLDFDIDNFGANKQMQFPGCTSTVPTIGMSSTDTINPAHLHFNGLTQEVPCSGLDMGLVNPPDHVSLRRTISAPISIPDPFLGPSCLNVSSSFITM